MSGWDFNSQAGSSQKAEFTKFPVGISKIRVIDKEPFMRWTHWIPAQKRSINCPGKGCPICEVRRQQKANKEPYTYPMSRRLAMNIYNLETGKNEIMEQGVNFFEDLRDIMDDLNQKGNELVDGIIKVRRRGTTKDDTSYRLDLDDTKPLSGIDLEEAKSKAINLQEYFKPHTNDQIIRIMKGEAWDEVMKTNEGNSTSPVEDEEVVIE